MLKTDRLCVWVLIFGFAMFIPSIYIIKFADELCALMLALVVGLDCIVNGNWKRYVPLWLVVAFFGAYVVYSIFFVHFNTVNYVLMDFVIEIKTLISFLTFYCVKPRLTCKDKAVLRRIALINSSIIALSFLGGYALVALIVFHVAFAGIVIFVSMLIYISCSIQKDGTLDMHTIRTACIYMLIGIACTRSKYYGECVLFLFMMLIYKPNMFNKINYKHVFMMIGVLALVIAVAWQKIQYYFLMGGGETFDPNEVATFARPVMYATGALILVDYFPFGTGLASFGSYASQNYSDVYYEYGIDKVFGLSPQMPDFICDALYPSLAQFGVIGVILFFGMFVWIYGRLAKLLEGNPKKFHYQFVVGVLGICFILIEGVAGTAFTMSCGFIIMAYLGYLCSMKTETSESVAPEEKLSHVCMRKI